MPKTKKVVKKGEYEASIKVLGQFYKSKGSTSKEAIENLKVGNFAKGVGVLEITKGDVKKSKILPAPQVFRLFSASPLMREIALKNVGLMFDL